MKITKLLPLVILSVFVLSACSNSENLLTETEQKNSLKSFKVKRDASGAYSLDYELESDVTSQAVNNFETNTNEFHLYQSDFAGSNKQTQELFIDGNQLNIGFVDTRTDKKSNITIEDDYVSSIKTSAKEKKMLSKYSVTSNEEGLFNVEFKVNNQVVVDFVFDEETSIYEIHLKEGKSTETVFSRSLTKVAGKPLKIDFVSHIGNNTSAKGSAARSSVKRRKPRIVVVGGDLTM
jgi:hypothetical protein